MISSSVPGSKNRIISPTNPVISRVIHNIESLIFTSSIIQPSPDVGDTLESSEA
jgi:hypothetical protein